MNKILPENEYGMPFDPKTYIGHFDYLHGIHLEDNVMYKHAFE